MIRTQIQLTEEQVQRLKGLSKSKGVSTAELVRRAIDKMTSDEMLENLEERVSRAKEAVGKFSSGSSDGSTKHDDYFSASVLS